MCFGWAQPSLWRRSQCTISTSVHDPRLQVTAGSDACPIRRLSAAEIEAAVLSQIKVVVQSPEIIVATWKAAKQTQKGLTEQQVREHMIEFAALWSELFPAEQARLIQLLVARVQITPDGTSRCGLMGLHPWCRSFDQSWMSRSA